MAVTEATYTGNGSTTNYSFTFPYLKTTDVKASINGTATTAFTFANATTVQFNTAPANSSAIRIYRDTDDSKLEAEFFAGSAIKSSDLNDNFTQNLYVTQEANNQVDTAWTKGTETIDSTETWASNNTRVSTTGATDARIDSKIDTALEGDVLAGTDLTKSTSSGQVTINHSVTGASSVDNSNGSVIQDLTINGRGHVTATGSVNLDDRYYTETELNAGQLDNRYYTETEADARFYNLASTEEIQSGETWVAADNKVATTSAIDARIVDLVDDVGGFVPIANETSFPNANPDVNNGAGTLVSIKALSSNLTSNGSGVATISNGTVGNSTVTINGLANSTTYAAGFGMIVETTTTLNTYSFHRQVPKATEVTTVATNITNINTVAGSNTNINTVAGANSNISTVAGAITNVNNVGGSIANVNTVASNLTTVNDFAARYRVASSAPSSSLDTGDLYFDTSANELKVYNGSAWQGGVTASGNFATTGANQFTGNITFTGSQTVDGRDVSVDGTKLDGIAASANNYSISSDLLDEDDFATNSATKAASQQSIKAYVDGNTSLTKLTVNTGTEVELIDTGSNAHLKISLDGSEKARFNTDGELLIGTTISSGAPAVGRQLILKSDGNGGLTILGGNAHDGHIFFADTDSNLQGGVSYDHNGDYMYFRVNGDNERFRIASAGQLGIAGANYGTSGQVLTSGGASAAPTWASAGGVWEKLGETNISSDTSAVDLTSIGTTYDIITVYFYDIKTSGVSDIGLLVQTGGSTWQNDAGDYQWGGVHQRSNATGTLFMSNTNQPIINLTGSNDPWSNPASGFVQFYNPGKADAASGYGTAFNWMCQATYRDGSANGAAWNQGGGYYSGTEAITGIRIRPVESSPHFDNGRVVFYGLKS